MVSRSTSDVANAVKRRHRDTENLVCQCQAQSYKIALATTHFPAPPSHRTTKWGKIAKKYLRLGFVIEPFAHGCPPSDCKIIAIRRAPVKPNIKLAIQPTSQNSQPQGEFSMTSNLTKREIVLEIYEKTGFPQKEVVATVQMTLDIIMHALAKGRNVELRNFGVLEVQKRKARVGRNPNKPETEVVIPERAVVKFKSGKILKQLIKKIDVSKL
jgi:integration host factor subunit beta